MFENVDTHTHTHTYPQTKEAYLYYKLGSGELKIGTEPESEKINFCTGNDTHFIVPL